MLAEDGDVPRFDDAMHDLMDDGTFARSLWAIEEVAAAVQIAVFEERSPRSQKLSISWRILAAGCRRSR